MPQENQGIFPADREFWTRRFGYSPQEGEVLSLAIGQVPNSQTWLAAVGCALNPRPETDAWASQRSW